MEEIKEVSPCPNTYKSRGQQQPREHVQSTLLYQVLRLDTNFSAAVHSTGVGQARSPCHFEGSIALEKHCHTCILVLATQLAQDLIILFHFQAQLRACVFAVVEEQEGTTYGTGNAA